MKVKAEKQLITLRFTMLHGNAQASLKRKRHLFVPKIPLGLRFAQVGGGSAVTSHKATGLPLRSFLWPLQNEEQKMHEYAQVVAEKAFRVRRRDQN